MDDQSMLAQSKGSVEDESRAVVIGGSLAGLLAAQVLLNHFDQVTIIERDRYPDAPLARKGLPQARHAHVLLMRGREILARLFTGLEEELVAAGALRLDAASDLAWLTPAGWGVNFRSELRMLAFSRDLLDWHVRRRLAGCPRVRFVEEGTAAGLVAAEEGGRVAGVEVHFAARAEQPARAQLFPADLIVDASGRASRAPEWIEKWGGERTGELRINSFLGYASRLYRLPSRYALDRKAVFIQAAPPERTRGGILFPVEGDRWLVTLIGGGGDYPPTDENDFLAFAQSLPSPLVSDAISEGIPLAPIYTHRGTENRWRRFDQLRRQPENFVVTGDAACAFNPVYGQGMTIAALGAETLDECLREQSARQDLRGFARRFQKALARVNAAPWMLATGEDHRYRQTVGGAPRLTTRLMHRYMDEVVKLSTAETEVRRLLLEVFGMLRPPSALFRPPLIFRVIARMLRPAPKQPARTGRRRTPRGTPALHPSPNKPANY